MSPIFIHRVIKILEKNISLRPPILKRSCHVSLETKKEIINKILNYDVVKKNKKTIELTYYDILTAWSPIVSSVNSPRNKI